MQRHDRLLRCKPRWSNKFVSQECLQQLIEWATGIGELDDNDTDHEHNSFDTDKSDTEDLDEADTEAAILSDIMTDAAHNDMDGEGDLPLSGEVASRIQLIWQMPVCGKILSHNVSITYPTRLRFPKIHCFLLNWRTLWHRQLAM